LGLPAHRAPDSQHFSLAARQRACRLIEPLPQFWKDGEDAVDGSGIAIAQRADREVVPHRQPCKHGMLLRHIADAHADPGIGLTAGNIPTIEEHLAIRRREFANNRLHQRRLAGTVAAKLPDYPTSRLPACAGQPGNQPAA
jgi:hypothetical protein